MTATMRYTLLGNSGLRVSELALGTMTFGTDWGWGAAPDAARQQFDLFAEAGGNFVDTASNYTGGSAERIVGELLSDRRDEFVVATKYSLTLRAGDPNGGGNSRKSLVQSVESSLRRLRTDRIDLLWLHAWDFLTPPDEVIRALDDQVRAGKLLYIGVSDTPAWLIARMQTIAELRGWSPFVGLQVEYSLVARDVERELLPMARTLGLGVTAWSPLAGGVLSGKYGRRPQASADQPRRLDVLGRRQIDERSLAIADAVNDAARELGVPASQVALAWLRSKGGVIPILGARTAEQLADNLGCLGLTLPDDVLARLDEVGAIKLGFPHDLLADARGLLLGEHAAEIDLPPGRHLIGR
jgi:aryl-alcohol dehydrogenase-like predicted oxidoreductase